MTNFRRLHPAVARRLASIARRSVGLPVNARAPRLTPATGVLSLEAMADLVNRAEARS